MLLLEYPGKIGVNPLLPILIPIEFHILDQLDLEHSSYITPAVLISSSAFALPFLTNNLVLRKPIVPVITFVGINTMTITSLAKQKGIFK